MNKVELNAIINQCETIIGHATRKFERFSARTFVHVDAGYSTRLRWREINTAFESRILTGAVINSKHIEPRQFLEDASEIVLERVRTVMIKYAVMIQYQDKCCI